MAIYNSRHTGVEIDDLLDRVSDNGNQNLLMNAFFRINQRGQTSYDGNSYCVDRWRLYNMSITNVSEYGLECNAVDDQFSSARIIQPFKASDLDFLIGKTITITMRIDAPNARLRVGVYGGSGSQSSATQYINAASVTDTNGYMSITATMPEVFTTEYVNFLFFPCYDSQTHILKSVKVEFGSVSTLANDIIPDDGEELLKCQRYIHAYGSAAARPSNALDCVPHMRATPSQTTVVDADGVTRYLNVAEL